MKTQFRLPGGDLEYAVLVIGAILGVEDRHTVLRLGAARALAPTLCRVAGTCRGARDFNCGGVDRLLKKSNAQAMETTSPNPQQHSVLVPN
jgi:hypothetical protein